MKQLLIAIILLMLVNNAAYAAFPITTNLPATEQAAYSAATVTSGTGINYGDTIVRHTSYRNQYHKPYHNREREAKLAFTFGLLGLLVFFPLGIAAFILGIIAADRRNKYYDKAKAGLIMGAVCVFGVLLTIALTIAFAL